jgi:tetratricopeptide (TPR) repeat protein
MLQYSADLVEAERMYRRALAIRRRLLREDHPDIADTLHDLASVLFQTHALARAEVLAAEALAVRRIALPTGHPGIGASLFLLADILLERGDPTTAELAETLVNECVEIRRTALGDNHWLTAEAESVLGECLVVLNRFDEAEPILLSSFATLADDCGDSHDRTRRARQRLIELYNACGKASEAARYHNPTPDRN